MNKIIIIGLFLFFANNMSSQEDAFDFWVGEWKVSWYDSDSNLIVGSNNIEKTLDGKVIQEHFSDHSTNFYGTSISVFNSATKTWHQAWADNQGGYYNFIGIVDEGIKVFQTAHPNTLGMIFRMRFEDIKQDSFIWYWEGKKEAAIKWNLLWEIKYKRI